MKFGTILVAVLAAIGVIQFARPAHSAPERPFASVADAHLSADASLNAFGASREVQLRFAMPGATVEFPLEVSGDPATLQYEWISAHDTTAADDAQPLMGDQFVAPQAPGFYHLAVLRGTERQLIPQPTLAVMVPFRDKIGSTLNGYHIGTYIAERLLDHEHPAGFLQVGQNDVDLRVSTHLKLGDFLTHDDQENVWPKYVALNPRLLDKLELVLAKIGAHARLSSPTEEPQELAFDVHSGFRTPAHNRVTWRAAGDSRHQYGDAADVVIDADGDGRITMRDEMLVARAVDQVEDEHPDLVGGMGLYTSHHYRTPYVHIDTRGKRTRWRG